MSSKVSNNKKIIDIITKAAGVLLLAAGVFLLTISILLNLLQYSASQGEIEEYKAVLASSKALNVDKSGEVEKSENEAVKGYTEDDGQDDIENMPIEDTAEEEEQHEEPVSEPLYILRIPGYGSADPLRCRWPVRP